MWFFSNNSACGACCSVCRATSSTAQANDSQGSAPLQPTKTVAATDSLTSKRRSPANSLAAAANATTQSVSTSSAAPAASGGALGDSLELPKKGSTDTLATSTLNPNSGRSAYSAASSLGSEFINDRIPAHQREVARIQQQMKAFVKGMVRGREMSVLSLDGQLRACTCTFDRKLKSYSIVLSKETRTIPLAKFREILQGLEPEDIDTPLDELCATAVLDNGECISFRFKDVAERENFAICLQIIVDGHQP